MGWSSGILSHKFQPWPETSPPQVMIRGRDAPGRSLGFQVCILQLWAKIPGPRRALLHCKVQSQTGLPPSCKDSETSLSSLAQGMALTAKDLRPAKDLQAWAGVLGPSDSSVMGDTCHDGSVPPAMCKAPLGTTEPVPGRIVVLLIGVVGGCTNLAWLLCGGSTPRQTPLGPGLQALSWQVQSEAGQGPRQTGPLVHG